MKRELQNSIRAQIRACFADSDFSQIAYDQKDMSICEKPNRLCNHRIWAAKRVLQFPLKRKRALTLIEVFVAIVLLGVLLTGLFNTFRHAMKKNLMAKELKQKVLQLELFQQKMRTLLRTETKVWIDAHPEAVGKALILNFETPADPDFEGGSTLTAMLYLDGQKQLQLAVWSESGQGRVETLLDKIESFSCSLFDPKKGEWSEGWPRKKEEPAAMASVDLKYNGGKIPFVFFLPENNSKITYKGNP